MRIYVNGVQVSSSWVSGSIRTSSDPLTIGGSVGWGRWFAGQLDEVRIYNRALTQSEIQTGMNKTLGGA